MFNTPLMHFQYKNSTKHKASEIEKNRCVKEKDKANNKINRPHSKRRQETGNNKRTYRIQSATEDQFSVTLHT